MIRVITKGNLPRAFPNEMLYEIALEVAGGGYTEKQTIVAMMIVDNLIDHGKVKLAGGKILITMDDDGQTEKLLSNLSNGAAA